MKTKRKLGMFGGMRYRVEVALALWLLMIAFAAAAEAQTAPPPKPLGGQQAGPAGARPTGTQMPAAQYDMGAIVKKLAALALSILVVPGSALAQKRPLATGDIYNMKEVRDPQRSPNDCPPE